MFEDQNAGKPLHGGDQHSVLCHYRRSNLVFPLSQLKQDYPLLPFCITSNKWYFNHILWSLSAFLTVIITSTCISVLQLCTKPVEFSLYLPGFFSSQFLYKRIQESEEIEKHLVCDPVS